MANPIAQILSGAMMLRPEFRVRVDEIHADRHSVGRQVGPNIHSYHPADIAEVRPSTE